MVFGFCAVLLLAIYAPARAQFNEYKQHSLYTDVKAHTVGDIVTILIIESTTGSQQSGVNSSDKASMKASGNITGNLTSVLPLLGAASDFESGHDGKSGSQQKDLLTGKITAVVTGISGNGNLSLQGKRRVQVNGESYVLDIKGMVRSSDITAENLVYSYNVANVEIAYKKSGLSNSLGRPGWIARWTTWAMVAGLGAAAYFGISAAN
jgi:flagellar L-ring protein precursor FlgH